LKNISNHQFNQTQLDVFNHNQIYKTNHIEKGLSGRYKR